MITIAFPIPALPAAIPTLSTGIPAKAGTHLQRVPNETPSSRHALEMGSRFCGNAGRKVADPRLAKVAQQFEALFVGQMLKSARAAALADDPFEGPAGATFRDFQDEQRAQALAKAAPLGVAKLLSSHR